MERTVNRHFVLSLSTCNIIMNAKVYTYEERNINNALL